MDSEFRLLVQNPGREPQEFRAGSVEEARRLAAEHTRPDGRAELLDAAVSRTVWIRDGRTGQELDPGA